MKECIEKTENRIFQTGKLQQDRAYQEMLSPIATKAARENIFEMASRAGGCVLNQGNQIMLRTFEKQVTVRIPECEINPVLENWHALVLLHYIVNADGMPPTGEWISFEDMRNGLVRGTRFARASALWFSRFLKDKSIGQVESACLALGGEKTEGRGDINISLFVFPNFPVLISLWDADEDFDASGKILLDRNADHYLTIEDAVTVGEIIQKQIEAHLPTSGN